MEFVLADKTPAGGPTTGIERIIKKEYFEHLGGGVCSIYSQRDSLVGASISWDPTHYLNVITFKGLTPPQQRNWTYYPWYRSAFPWWNFVAYQYTNVGSTANARILAHEIGHDFAMYHVNDSSCGGSCTSSGLTTGDFVDDTDPFELIDCYFGPGVCSQEKCGVPRTNNNYMLAGGFDTSCMNRFTQVQGGRMRCGLETYFHTLYLGIIESSIQEESVTQFCVGGVRRLRLVVPWDTNLATNGPDSLLVYAPGTTCPGSTTLVSTVTPTSATTHHTVT